MKNFLKYYWLEQYLEKEVKPLFQKNGYLTVEQFFAIVIWKRNASKTNTKRGLGKSRLKGKIKKITSDVFHEQSEAKKLEILMRNKGIGIAIASAILTILYPKRFTVYDFRALGEVNKQLKNKGEESIRKIENISKREEQLEEYRRYCKEVQVLARKNKMTLRDYDRALWAKSWYEDLQRFLAKKDD